MSLLPTEEYVESGYLLDADYVGGVADAVIGISPYVEEFYIEAGYFEPGGSAFTLVVDLTLAVEFGSADLNSAFSLDATALRIKTSTSLLEYFASLDAQADRSRATDISLFSEFAIGHLEDGGFSNNVLPAVTYDSTADLSCSASISCDALIVQFGDAELNASATVYANPIEYILRENQTPVPGVRPHYPTTINQHDASDFATGVFGNAVSLYHSPTASINEYITYTMSRSDIGNPDANSSLNIDVWLYNQAQIQAWTDSGTASWQLLKTSSNNILFYLNRSNNNQNSRLSTTSGTSGWDHVRVRVDNNAFSMWVNGTRVDTYSGSLVNAASSDTMYLTFGWDETFESSFPSNGSFSIDEFRLLRGSETNLNTDTGHSVSTTSITVPTSELNNTLNTRALFHFNDDYKDDTSNLTIDFASTQNSTASVSATLSGTQTASATLEAFAATVTVAAKSGTLVASLDSAFALSATGTRNMESSAVLNSTADISATGTKTSTTLSTMNSVADIDVSVVKTVDAAVDLNSAASLLTDITTFVGVDAQLNSTAAVVAEPLKILQLSSELAANSSISGDVLRIRDSEITVNSSADLTSTGTRIKQFEAALSGFASTLTVAAKTGDFLIALDNNASLSADATVLGSGSVPLSVVAGFSSTVDRIRSSESNLSTQSSLTATGLKTSETDATFTVTADIAASGTKTTDIVSTNLSTATLNCAPDKIKPVASVLGATATLGVTGAVTGSTSASLASTTSMVASGGLVQSVNAELTAFGNISVRTRLILTTLAVYRVPRETRTHTVTSESRTHTIVAETRNYKLASGA